MNKEGLRKVEICEKYSIKSLSGTSQHIVGEDEFYDIGSFHGWDNSGDLKGIVELEDGSIKLVPYECIRFINT